MTKLLKHLIKYLPSIIMPAISGVMTLAVLTRILPTREYGLFALSTATMMMLQAIFVQWLSLAIVRFYTASDEEHEKNSIIASVAIFFTIETPLVFTICAIVAFTAFDTNADRAIIFLSFLYYAAFSLFTLTQRIHVATFSSRRFSINSVIQTTLSALLAISLPYFIAPTAIYAITGMILGFIVTSMLDARTAKSLLRISFANKNMMGRIAQFSGPTILYAGLVTLIARIDRFILLAILGSVAVGQYNAGYALANQAISSIFLLVALVAHPMAITAFEKESPELLKSQLSRNFLIMAGLALPAAVGLCSIRSELSHIILGAAFRQSAIDLMPVLVSAILISGIKEHYIAHSFHLAKKMWLPVVALVPVAIGSLIANYLFIPDLGLIGAAYVALGAQIIALSLSYALSFRAIPMPVPIIELGKICVATIIMGIAVFAIQEMTIWLSLITKVTLGILLYIVALFLLNPVGIRQQFLMVLGNKTEK